MKVDIPPIAREELDLGSFKTASPSVRKEIEKVLKTPGPSEASMEAVEAMRDHLRRAIHLLKTDKYMAKEPALVYHRQALEHGLSSLSSAVAATHVEMARCLLGL